MKPTTLQISLAPSDYRLAEALLPHQVDAWRAQVEEILLTVDTHRSRGRFGEDWETGRNRILQLAHGIRGARVLEVDYSVEAQNRVSQAFFGGAPVPAKDCRGGPYYAYFFGLYSARHDWVLHCDADLFFGGRSPTWLAEAIEFYEGNTDVLFVAPHPGPPAPDAKLRQLQGKRRDVHLNPGYLFPEMSTRVFLFQRERFRQSVGALQPRPPAARARVLAYLDGNPPQELPEKLITEAMRRQGLCRIDFLGTMPGCWSLHPPYRCADFYAKLPVLVAQVEHGEIPADQLGDHDINDSLVDWSEARARMGQRRWWRRLAERVISRS